MLAMVGAHSPPLAGTGLAPVGFSLLPPPLGEAEWWGGVGVGGGWARRDADEDDAAVGPGRPSTAAPDRRRSASGSTPHPARGRARVGPPRHSLREREGDGAPRLNAGDPAGTVGGKLGFDRKPRYLRAPPTARRRSLRCSSISRSPRFRSTCCSSWRWGWRSASSPACSGSAAGSDDAAPHLPRHPAGDRGQQVRTGQAAT